MKAENEEIWSTVEHLMRIDNVPYLAVFEFKFVIDLMEKEAKKDFKKLHDIKDKNVKRAYFVCIYQNDKSNIWVNKSDKWIINYYRECNAFPKNNEWIFEFRFGEKILKE